MRTRAFAVLSVTFALAAPSDARAEIPFTFRSFVAGQTVDPATLKKCGHKDGEVNCINLSDEVAGKPARTVISFYNNMLTSVYADINRDEFLSVLTAVKAKYGDPCGTSSEEWQSKGGVKLENSVISWCFSTGKLTLKEVGSSLDKMYFFYQDHNVAPPTDPVVDF